MEKIAQAHQYLYDHRDAVGNDEFNRQLKPYVDELRAAYDICLTVRREKDAGMDKLTPDGAFKLGNQFRDTAIALGDWRIRNLSCLSKAQWDELDEREVMLLNIASSIYTATVGMVLEDSQEALKRLQSSVESTKSAIKHIATLKQALDLASALVLLAGPFTQAMRLLFPAQ